ncbi:MAG: HAD family hydrolase, partial [Bradyrhizobium sp.]|nr:HAD family hydrolase [Bradyrhizobium sp.]
MSPIHSVLLDLDGTLIDSRPGIAASTLAALRSLGHTPDD